MPKSYRTPVIRCEPRTYPAGTFSTAEYVAKYYALNGFKNLDQIYHFPPTVKEQQQ
jgi:hypothetical protein